MHIIHTISYYDGSVEGLLLWKNHIYYYVWIDDDLQGGVRIFALARLEPYQYFLLRTVDTRTLLHKLPTFRSYGLNPDYTEEYTLRPDEYPLEGYYAL